MRETSFHVEVQTSNGLWTRLFDADFPMAMREVEAFKRRGIKARFRGDVSSRRTAKGRTEYRAVR